MAAKGGEIKTLKDVKKWLNQKEPVDAPQVVAKRWRAVTLQHDGRDICLREWRDFRGQYVLFPWNMEDWRLDECEVGGQRIRMQAVPARMSSEDVLEWIRE